MAEIDRTPAARATVELSRIVGTVPALALDASFRPSRRLRERRLNQYFPGERSADIVVRIAAHRRTLSSARPGQSGPVYWDEALDSFAEVVTPARAA